MKKIYILLIKSGTNLSKVIRFVTGDTYSHAAISFEESLAPTYSSTRKNGRTLFPSGPCIEQFQSDYYQKNRAGVPCLLYELTVSEEVYQKALQEASQIIENAEDYKFNILGLVLCPLHIPFHRKRHFFCSQFVSEVLRRSHALNLPKDPTLMKPSDFIGIPELNCRYRGLLSELLLERRPVMA